MARTTRALRRLVLRGVQVVLIGLAAAVILLYGWAFLTLKDEDLKAASGPDQRSEYVIGSNYRSSRKIVLGRQSQAGEREGFPKLSALSKGPHGGLDVPMSSPPPPRRSMTFPFTDPKYRIYKLPENDTSERCRLTGICDGDHSCGPDKLGCVTGGRERQAYVQEAARWSWAGYRCPFINRCVPWMIID